MFETFFGSEMPLAVRFFIAFLVVLALIGLTAWLVRRFGASRLGGNSARGRQPRLAVIDAASVDARRRLILIRRDNVEHLLMIGGPTDVVVEQNIVRAAGAREPARPGMPEPAARSAAPAETAWPLQPMNESPPVIPTAPPTRGYRASSEEPWLPPEPGARPRPSDSLSGMASEFPTRANAPDHAPPVRHDAPHVVPPLPPEPTPSPQNDRNLAEMAQQLEAALRRAPAPSGEHRPPVTDALAGQPAEAPRAPVRDIRPRAEPKFESRFEPKPAPKAEPKAEPRFEPKTEPKFEPKFEPAAERKPEFRPDPKPEPKSEPKSENKPEMKAEAPKIEPRKPEPSRPDADGKSAYDSLEEEMASLLGRPPGKT